DAAHRRGDRPTGEPRARPATGQSQTNLARGADSRRGEDARGSEALHYCVSLTSISPAVTCSFRREVPLSFSHRVVPGKRPERSMISWPRFVVTSPTRQEAESSRTPARGVRTFTSPARRSMSTSPKLPSRVPSPYVV